MGKRVNSALIAIEVAEARLYRAIEAEYQVGRFVTWERGGRQYQGTVLALGYKDRIKVINDSTGGEYWIHAEQTRRR